MIENGCVAFKPTIWHRLGFGGAYVDFPDEEAPDMPVGAIICDTYIRLCWADRLRLLMTGCLFVQIKTKTDVTVETAVSRSAVGVLWPSAMPARHR
jgi:hypothetical protein